jgi:hypothetical protein
VSTSGSGGEGSQTAEEAAPRAGAAQQRSSPEPQRRPETEATGGDGLLAALDAGLRAGRSELPWQALMSRAGNEFQVQATSAPSFQSYLNFTR